MADAQTLEDMSPGLLKVVERAQRAPEGRFNSLAHLIDVPALTRAYRRQRTDAAVGVDGVTKDAYGRHLEGNLQDPHTRRKAQRSRHQPIRRVHIPKAQGKTRPIGISIYASYCLSLRRRLGITMAENRMAKLSISGRDQRKNPIARHHEASNHCFFETFLFSSYLLPEAAHGLTALVRSPQPGRAYLLMKDSI